MIVVWSALPAPLSQVRRPRAVVFLLVLLLWMETEAGMDCTIDIFVINKVLGL
jgi:hypothetical protein